MSTKYLQLSSSPVVPFQALDHCVRAAAIADKFSIRATSIEAAGVVLLVRDDGLVSLPADIGNDLLQPIAITGTPTGASLSLVCITAVQHH